MAKKRNRWMLAGLLVLSLFVPVRLSVLAPAEVVALNAIAVAAPQDGVVGSFAVAPNAKVKAGDLLFSLDDSSLLNRLAVARKALEIAQVGRIVADLPGRQPFFQAVRRQRPGRFPDVPLDRVQAVAAVGDMGNAQIFTGWQQILDPLRQQGAQRNLERPGRNVHRIAVSGAGVQVNPVAADTDRIGEKLRAL